MEWKYWNKEEEDMISALKLEERKLRLILKRYFPDEEKKLTVIYSNMSEKNILARAYLDQNKICINKKYIFCFTLEENIDTLRHEFAHFFSFNEIGDVWIKRKGKDVYWPHNRNWKKWCRFLRCVPRAMMQLNLHLSI